MAKKFLSGLTTKKRTMILFGSVLLIVIILIVVISTHKTNPFKTEESRASKVPDIASIPGNKATEKYQGLVEEKNRLSAEQAKKLGGSSVPTIIGSREKDVFSNTLGIEGQFANAPGGCKCPPAGFAAALDPALAAQLISDIERDPSQALKLLRDNPGLAKALCTQKPDLALQVIQNNKEAARIMLKECPAMAKALAEKNPALLKELLLEDPELAKTLAETNPELLKQLIRDDPEFANKLAKTSPDAFKTLMKNDPEFAAYIGKTNPELVKELMRGDKAFAALMAKNNPALVKSLMLSDPEFARAMATNNPELVKDLMRGDPDFAASLAKANPTLVKELMKNDPAFANQMMKLNPAMVKSLMLADPEFARALARTNADAVAEMMEGDAAFTKELLAKNPAINAIVEANRSKQPFLTDKQRIAALEEARRKERAAQTRRAQQVQLSEEQKQQLESIMSNMDTQTKAAFQAWNDVPAQQFTQGDYAKNEGASGGGGGGGGGPGPGGPPPGVPGGAGGQVLIKAGTVYFAVLDTAVNTDEPGPILATIVEGKFKGSKLLGSLQLSSAGGAGDRPEKVSLTFATMNVPSLPKSISIQGVAIDPETARTALASDVDHHYLLRYGTVLASSFITGYGQVIASAGTTQTNTIAGNTTTTTPQLSGRDKIFAALGTVGQKLGQAWSTYFQTPNTITVDAGTGFGLLLLNDVNA